MFILHGVRACFGFLHLSSIVFLSIDPILEDLHVEWGHLLRDVRLCRLAVVRFLVWESARRCRGRMVGFIVFLNVIDLFKILVLNFGGLFVLKVLGRNRRLCARPHHFWIEVVLAPSRFLVSTSASLFLDLYLSCFPLPNSYCVLSQDNENTILIAILRLLFPGLPSRDLLLLKVFLLVVHLILKVEDLSFIVFCHAIYFRLMI